MGYPFAEMRRNELRWPIGIGLVSLCLWAGQNSAAYGQPLSEPSQPPQAIAKAVDLSNLTSGIAGAPHLSPLAQAEAVADVKDFQPLNQKNGGVVAQDPIAQDTQSVDTVQLPAVEEAIAPSEFSLSSPSFNLELAQATVEPPENALDLDPQVVEDSPVLQRWSEEIPNVLAEIRNDPAFRTRLRLGYSHFPSSDQAGGFHVGVEDLFLGETRFTASADYHSTFEGDRTAYGANLHYYLRPLGRYINIAPVVGYRYLHTDNYTTDGVNVGARLMLALSRTGAADIVLSQTWVNPGNPSEEVGITTLSVGYAFTSDLRIATDLQKQNSADERDSRVAISLEWMP